MILLKNLLKCDVAHQFFQPMLYPQKRSEFFISDHLQSYEGMKVSDAIKLVKEFRHNLDLDVQFSNGDNYRIVAFYSEEKKDVVLMITNISREKMRARLITDVYRIRWSFVLKT